MKFLPGFVIVIIILLTSGCVGSTADIPVVEQTSAPLKDPIIGTWHWTLPDRSKTIFYTFFPDGQYSVTDTNNEATQSGIWTKGNDHHYNVTVEERIVLDFVYSPESHTLADAQRPGITLYPNESGPPVVSPKTTQTVASSKMVAEHGVNKKTPAPVHTAPAAERTPVVFGTVQV